MIIARDVIIVGAGISGSICASYLAKAGADVLLIDKEVFPRDKACGDLLTEGVVSHISRLGAFDELDKVGSCLRRAHLIGENGSECVIPFEAYVAPRFQFDSMLVEIAVKRGAEFRDGCRVRELLIEDGRICGVKVREKGVDYEIRSRIVVLANGAESVLTAQLGDFPKERNFTRSGKLAGERAYFEGVKFDEFMAKGRYNAYGVFGFHRQLVNGYYWVVPSGEHSITEGFCNVGIVYDPEFAGPDVNAQEIFADLIASNGRIASLMLGAKQVSPWKQGVLKDVKAADFAPRCGNGFLVIGDAAAVMMPLFKDGVSAAADSAEQAAIAVKNAISADDFSEEFFEKEYIERIQPDAARLKYENITVESMYDVSVPMQMIARMTNNPTYVKRVLKEVF